MASGFWRCTAERADAEMGAGGVGFKSAGEARGLSRGKRAAGQDAAIVSTRYATMSSQLLIKMAATRWAALWRKPKGVKQAVPAALKLKEPKLFELINLDLQNLSACQSQRGQKSNIFFPSKVKFFSSNKLYLEGFLPRPKANL